MPNAVELQTCLGNLLKEAGQLAEALDAYRRAIGMQPGFARAHYGLGTVFDGMGRPADAEVAYREAIRLKLDFPEAHYNLGLALATQRRPADAEAAYRRAIALKPTFAEAHCNLGGALQRQRRFAEALAAFRRGHELGRGQPGWSYPSEQWVRKAEELAALEALLPRILAGEAPPADPAEQIALARFCQENTNCTAAAARLFAGAFAARPAFAEDMQTQDRYNAACAAALAAAGRGGDAAHLDDAERARLRRQALDWLTADLAAWAQRAENPNALARLWEKITLPGVRETLDHWQKDPDLAGVRDDAALARLPAAEQEAWRKLWAGVAATLAQARADGAPGEKSDQKP